MAGEAYYVFVGGSAYLISGTSASAPVFAGLVSLVNSYRLYQGWSSVGSINSAIYSNNGVFANDVVSGDNYCTSNSSRCCASVGFTCDSSWDPVTGFGSINYDLFLSYFSYKIPSTATRNPSIKPTAYPTTGPTIKSTTSPSIKPSLLPSSTPIYRPTCITLLNYSLTSLLTYLFA